MTTFTFERIQYGYWGRTSLGKTITVKATTEQEAQTKVNARKDSIVRLRNGDTRGWTLVYNWVKEIIMKKTSEQVANEFKAELKALVEKYEAQIAVYGTCIDANNDDYVLVETEVTIPEKSGVNDFSCFSLPNRISSKTQL